MLYRVSHGRDPSYFIYHVFGAIVERVIFQVSKSLTLLVVVLVPVWVPS